MPFFLASSPAWLAWMHQWLGGWLERFCPPVWSNPITPELGNLVAASQVKSCSATVTADKKALPLSNFATVAHSERCSLNSPDARLVSLNIASAGYLINKALWKDFPSWGASFNLKEYLVFQSLSHPVGVATYAGALAYYSLAPDIISPSLYQLQDAHGLLMPEASCHIVLKQEVVAHAVQQLKPEVPCRASLSHKLVTQLETHAKHPKKRVELIKEKASCGTCTYERLLELPLLRNPLPLNRLEARLRAELMASLAKRYALPNEALQLIRVYDRLYQGYLQTVDMLESKQLACLLKPDALTLARRSRRAPLEQPLQEWFVIAKRLDANSVNERWLQGFIPAPASVVALPEANVSKKET